MALINREPFSRRIFYPNLPSAMGPVPYSSEIPILKPTETLEDIPDDSEDKGWSPDEEFSDYSDRSEPQTHSQRFGPF
ncbi:hypothetical protein AVEN_53842-1 [Araneus ventricosus]|uniref:Uncharacterized protein n=1 Tax=Araneus ventricosus TaxID=182803 RepID=A0A4Y2F0D3_ARAVE|nr:hypothetical protein AVEN_53842-1 [Araneus ventricosus]